MRLRKGPRPSPLVVPTFGDIHLPDPQTTGRYFDDIEAVSKEVAQQVRENADALGPTASRIVQSMIPVLASEPGGDAVFTDDAENMSHYAYAVALGVCLASQEFQRGWTKEGSIDGRVKAAMALARPPGDAVVPISCKSAIGWAAPEMRG